MAILRYINHELDVPEEGFTYPIPRNILQHIGKLPVYEIVKPAEQLQIAMVSFTASKRFRYSRLSVEASLSGAGLTIGAAEVWKEPRAQVSANELRAEIAEWLQEYPEQYRLLGLEPTFTPERMPKYALGFVALLQSTHIPPLESL